MTDTTRLLDPREAAAWNDAHGCPGTYQTLEKWRVLGRGPAWIMVGRRVRSAVADLEAFARGQRHETADSCRASAASK